MERVRFVDNLQCFGADARGKGKGGGGAPQRIRENELKIGGNMANLLENILIFTIDISVDMRCQYQQQSWL